ncbi:MAG: hypothetical protein KA383_04525 [Phycisphaerae bacterium]|nr:hypothetical protein [Phycisphaerae bacterium]
MSASEPTTTRAAPRVIQLPPPEVKRTSPWLVLVIVVLAALIAGLGLTLPAPANWLVVMLMIGVAAGLLLGFWWVTARSRRVRAEFFARHPDCHRDQCVNAVVNLVRGKVPAAGVLLEALGRADGTRPVSAQIICAALIEPPDVGDLRFEPYIITATELLWRRLLVLPFALALLTVWLLQVVHVIPGRVFNLGSFTYVIAIGIGTGIAWVWKSGFRPTYVRLAPGIVQIIEYGLRGRKPVIRSYPMEAGTVVVFKGEKQNVTVTLLRGEQRDVLPFGAVRKRAEKLERLWWALLSTAPTPPLSDEDLLG